MKKINSVCVYCASSSKINDSYFKAARELGRLLAKNNIRCVYGAGNQGLMGTLADETLSAGGNVLGVIPRFMQTEGWCHKELKNIIVTENMHERKTGWQKNRMVLSLFQAVAAQWKNFSKSLPGSNWDFIFTR